ncbi:MAG: PQQ-binding-like beta-propeller repeat protein, partial [Singulisphaera sp.]
RVDDGELLWEVNYPAQFGERRPLADGKAFVNGTTDVIVPIGNGQGAPVPLFGYTGSPTLHGNLIVTPVGGRRGGTIMAFDKRSGQVVWKALEEHVSYSSPIVAELAGSKQIVVMTGPRVVGLSLADGQLLWSHPFQIQYDESIGTPAVGADLVLITATGKPLTALRIHRDGNTWRKDVAWTSNILSSYLSSMVVGGDYVYGMNDGGEFSCLRLRDGKVMWTGGNHGYYSSPIVVGKRLFALNNEGRLALLGTDPATYRELGSSQLVANETWTMPALMGSRLYVRDKDGLTCFEIRP